MRPLDSILRALKKRDITLSRQALCLVWLVFSIKLAAAPCSNPVIGIAVQFTDEDTLSHFQADYPQYGVDGALLSMRGVAHKIDDWLADNGNRSTWPNVRVGLTVEYAIDVSITWLGWKYQINVYLVDMDLGKIVEQYGPELVTDVPSSLRKLVNQIGNLDELIPEYERDYPTPPRDPTIEITLNPKTLKIRKGADKSEITVHVMHCNGLPAYHLRYTQEVHFERQTEKGRVDSKKPWGKYTDPAGKAYGTYRLDYSKDPEPGPDILSIWTRGRGRKRFSAEGNVEIEGVKGTVEIEMLYMWGKDCSFDKRVSATAAFQSGEPKQRPVTIAGAWGSYNYEEWEHQDHPNIKGSNAFVGVNYTETCRWQYKNVYKRAFKAKVVGGRLDLKDHPEAPLTLWVALWHEPFEHIEYTRSGIKNWPVSDAGPGPFAVYNWPLTDGHSQTIGRFRYTLHLDKPL